MKKSASLFFLGSITYGCQSDRYHSISEEECNPGHCLLNAVPEQKAASSGDEERDDGHIEPALRFINSLIPLDPPGTPFIDQVSYVLLESDQQSRSLNAAHTSSP